jgi:hypothetical protein
MTPFTEIQKEFDKGNKTISEAIQAICFPNIKTVEYHREPTESEIRFGEGATHYLTIDLKTDSYLVYNKKTGKLKKWFVSPWDGLRYYR